MVELREIDAENDSTNPDTALSEDASVSVSA